MNWYLHFQISQCTLYSDTNDKTWAIFYHTDPPTGDIKIIKKKENLERELKCNGTNTNIENHLAL